MNFNNESVEEVMSICRVLAKDNETWCPGILDKATHEISPMWVASLLYIILDRYVSCYPDEQQIEFQETCLELFEHMLKEGAEEHIHKM
jgi:hypothetical protein